MNKNQKSEFFNTFQFGKTFSITENKGCSFCCSVRNCQEIEVFYGKLNINFPVIYANIRV